jgi:hypothetical protein
VRDGIFFEMPVFLYKGVGVGTHHHPTDLRLSGIAPANPGGVHSPPNVEKHIAHGSKTTPYVSLTKSYGVARDYAMNGGFHAPTLAVPAYVYEFLVPDNVSTIDPVAYIASHYTNPLVSPSYHHDGDQQFLGFVAYPTSYPTSPGPAPRPPGAAPATSTPMLHIQLEAIVFALRDAEVLVNGNIPTSWFNHRYDIY